MDTTLVEVIEILKEDINHNNTTIRKGNTFIGIKGHISYLSLYQLFDLVKNNENIMYLASNGELRIL